MADEVENIEVNNEVVTTTTPEQTIADTVQIDQIKHPNEDLDSRLDALMGTPTKKPANEAVTADKTKVQEQPKPAAKADDKKEETLTQQPRDRDNLQDRRTVTTPRHYGTRYRSDAQGNIVDAASGKVVAVAGFGRRAFDTMLPYINGLHKEVDDAKALAETYTKANTVAASLDLKPDEFTLGARFFKAWKADPKKFVEYLLTEAADAGIDTSDLGVRGGGVSATAIEQIIEKRLQDALKPFLPFAQEREENFKRQQEEEVAYGSVMSFMDEHPDAQIHADDIAKLMNAAMDQEKDLPISQAYLVLQNHALKNGLDWTKPLGPQILAKKNGGTVTTDIRQPATQQRLPPLNGASNSGGIIPKPNGTMGGLEDSGDIVKAAMREAGMVIE